MGKTARGSLRAIDLFSGAGGLSAGFEWAGAGSVVAAVEIDANAAETFKHNHPLAEMYVNDIKDKENISPNRLAADVGEVDVILGGPMCQGVSQRGPRDPHDNRNFAFWAFAEYVRELRPKYFLMENVPAVASDVHNRHLAIAVFEELESLGYALAAEVVCAAWFGVPQLRYRLVVMGSRLSEPTFPSSIGSFIAARGRGGEFTTVHDAISDLPAVGSGSGLDVQPIPTPTFPLSEYAQLMRGDATELYNHCSSDTDEINLNRIRHVPEGGNWHDIPLQLLPERFRHVRLSDHTTTYRRLHRDHPAHVITCLCGNVTAGAFTHPTQNRAITVREAARFQGFRDSFRFLGPRSGQYKQVGNAVPALMAKRLTEALIYDTAEARGEGAGWPGRISLAVLKSHPDRRLPFVLAPRYGALFGKRVHMRRTDLVAA